MTVTPAILRDRFPEFEDTTDLDDDRVQEFIDAALLEVTDSWGDLQDEGVMYRACQLIAESPYGFPMQLDPKTGETKFQKRFNEMRKDVGRSKIPFYGITGLPT